MRRILAAILAMGVCGQAWAWDDEDQLIEVLKEQNRSYEAEKAQRQWESDQRQREFNETEMLWNQEQSLRNQKELLKIEKRRLELEEERARRQDY
jgi:hypothetical protein